MHRWSFLEGGILFFKNYQNWYTIDALGLNFAIYRNFDNFNTSEIISNYLKNNSNHLKISQT